MASAQLARGRPTRLVACWAWRLMRAAAALPPFAAGIRLDSLLKLNDVKVTAAPAAALAAAAAAATSPRRRSGEHPAHEAQQQGAEAAEDGAAAPQANGTAAMEAPPPVKTLLEFVAWVVLRQEAEEGGGSKGAAGEQLTRAVRSGLLAQQLPDLALAVRRMQTGGWGWCRWVQLGCLAGPGAPACTV